MDYIIEKKDGVTSNVFCTGIVEPLGFIYIDAEEGSVSMEKRIILRILTQQGEEFITLSKPINS